MLAEMILIFISAFFAGLYCMYKFCKDDIKCAQNLEELKIKYNLR